MGDLPLRGRGAPAQGGHRILAAGPTKENDRKDRNSVTACLGLCPALWKEPLVAVHVRLQPGPDQQLHYPLFWQYPTARAVTQDGGVDVRGPPGAAAL